MIPLVRARHCKCGQVAGWRASAHARLRVYVASHECRRFRQCHLTVSEVADDVELRIGGVKGRVGYDGLRHTRGYVDGHFQFIQVERLAVFGEASYKTCAPAAIV